jgi:hypothetical protein
MGTGFLSQVALARPLDTLEIRPAETIFELNGTINLDRIRAGLPAGGWNITSNLTERVKAGKGGYTMTASDTSVTFSGFSPSELLGGESGSQQIQLLRGVLKLLGK